MPYTDPMDTYVDGELIETADINTWVANIDYLHSRPFTLWVMGKGDSAPTAVGDFAARQIANTGAGTHFEYLQTAIPDHFDTLVSAELLMMATTSYTAEYDVNTDYFNPDSGEAYNNHSGAILSTTVALTANVPLFIDISGALTSLAAGDILGVKASNSTGANGGNWYILGLRIIYTASDTTP